MFIGTHKSAASGGLCSPFGSGRGGIVRRMNFFPAIMYLLSNNLQKAWIVKGKFSEDFDD